MKNRLYLLLSLFPLLWLFGCDTSGSSAILQNSSSVSSSSASSASSSSSLSSGASSVSSVASVAIACTSSSSSSAPAGSVIVCTLAGQNSGKADGTGLAAQFQNPVGLALDTSGNIFVGDSKNHLIRKITSAGLVTTVAGGGKPAAIVSQTYGFLDLFGTAASFYNPAGVAVDAKQVYVADQANNLIRTVVPNISFSFVGSIPSNSTTLTVSSSSSSSSSSSANKILPGLTLTSAKISAGTKISEQLTGTPSGGAGTYRLNQTQFLASTNATITASGSNLVNTLAGAGLTWSAPYTASSTYTVDNGGASDSDLVNNIIAKFNTPTGVAVDTIGNVYVADYNNNLIRKISSSGVVTTVAGSICLQPEQNVCKYYQDADIGTNARFNRPYGIAIDSVGNLYVADSANQSIRKISPAGKVTTLAGGGPGTSGFADGTGTTARFNNPTGVAVDSLGNVYVADYLNNRIRKITSQGVVTTLAGSGDKGSVDGVGIVVSFNRPIGIAVNNAGNIIYVADFEGNRIRKISIVP